MIAVLFVYAVIAGIAIVEGLRAAFGRIRVRHRLSQVQTTLHAFRTAADDDSRQRLIMQAGFRTLSLGLLLFVTLVIACFVAALPLPWITIGPTTFMGYTVGLSVAALVWWRLRGSEQPRL